MTKEEITEDLKRQILRENYAPGQYLIERDLCEIYGISRTPMREILFSLMNTGLVIREAGRGFVVRRLDLKLLFEVFEARECIEGMAARLCCQRLTSTQQEKLGELRRELKVVDAGNGAHDVIRLGRELHQLIVATAGNSLISEVDERLDNLAWLISTMTRKVKSLESESQRYHIEIIDSILSGQPDTSEKIMREHIVHTFHSLIRDLKQNFHLDATL